MNYSDVVYSTLVNRSRVFVVAGLALASLAPAAAARAESVTCAEVIAEMRTDLQRGASAQRLAAIARRHPECKVQIAAAAEQARLSQKAPFDEAKGFLGPIGWVWNNVYYRVYQGNLVMMLIFGWALLLAPVIVVASAFLVLRGSAGAFRPPTAVPPTALSTQD
jgi:hypothetical protein